MRDHNPARFVNFISMTALLAVATAFLGSWRYNLPQAVRLKTAAYSATLAAHAAPKARSEEAKARLVEAYGRLPLGFEANNGQMDPAFQFLSRGSGYTMVLGPTAMALSLSASHAPEPRTEIQRRSSASRPRRETGNSPPAVVQVSLIGANLAARLTGLEELPGTTNYLLGSDPAKWRAGVPNYAKVECRDVYPGVNLVYYGNQRQLEYDFVVAPGADPSMIRFAVEGAESVEVTADGDLELRVSGERLRFRRPLVYQAKHGDRREVAARYVLRDENNETQGHGSRRAAVGFEVEPYDPAQPLVIDPVLVYSTYLGGNGEDDPQRITVDAAGNAYVTGWTYSANFPTTHAVQPVPAGGQRDAFVAKLNAAGDALVYCTYLGGGGEDAGLAIAVDSAGNAYIAGGTSSVNFPRVNAIQTTNAGDWDVFVAKLNAAGSALLYSTYLGGSGEDQALGMTLDAGGGIYLAGWTTSTNFPTANALQAQNRGGFDAFVSKLNAAGSALLYSTYLGGVGEDRAYNLAVDSAGNAYVTGRTASVDFPTTANALRRDYSGGNTDVFVAKLSAAGSGLSYSTYLGGSGEEWSASIVVDSAGDAYVGGWTGSYNFPLTADALQSTRGGYNDMFISKLNPAGSALLYSTLLGGSGSEYLGGLGLDSAGNMYFGGQTSSDDFPRVNSLPYVARRPDAIWVPVVAKLSASGSELVYSTLLGSDGGNAVVAVDSVGGVYITGTIASNALTILNPIQATYAGGASDLFIAKIAPSSAPNDAFAAATTVASTTLTDAADTGKATTEATDPPPVACGGGHRERSVWYKFAPVTSGAFVVDTIGSSYDTILSVWTGSPGSFSQVACNDDAFGSQSRVTVSMTAGTTYYFMVTAYLGDGGSLAFHLAPNGTPAISALSPASVAQGSGSLNLTISGSGFNSASVVRWNGADRATTLISASQLAVTIPAADLTVAGIVPVAVSNPAPGGGTSQPIAFTVTPPASSVPLISSLSPSTAAVGGPAFTLLVNGSNFVTGATVRWNGSARSTTFIDTTQLAATILASDIASPSSAQVTVSNPSPGGGTSNAVTFSIVTSALRRVILLTRPGTDATVEYFRGVLNTSSIPYNEAQASQITSTYLTNSLIIAGFSAEPTEYRAVAGAIGTAVSQGSWMIAEAYGRFILDYAGIGSARVVGWYPAVLDTPAYIKSIDGGPLFLGIPSWDPPVRPDRPSQYVSQVLQPGSKDPVDYTPPANEVGYLRYWRLYITYGWPWQSSTSDYCQSWGGCTPERTAGETWVPIVQHSQGKVLTFQRPPVITGAYAYGPVSTVLYKNFVTTFLSGTTIQSLPTVSSLSPPSAMAGSATFTVTVNGSNFVSGANVRWNGSARATTFVSSTRLTTSISASDIASAGTAEVGVVNPSGGGASGELPFAVLQPLLAVSLTSMGFKVGAGAGNPPVQSLLIQNQGTGSLGWTATATTQSGGNWLSLSWNSGSVAAGSAMSTSVTVNATGLSPGTYSGTVTVRIQGTSVSQAVAVTLTVESPTSVQLTTQPASLSFQVVAGAGDPLPRTLLVSNTGGASLPVTVTTTAAWLAVSPGSASTPTVVSVGVNTAGLTPGTYQGSVTIQAPTVGNPPLAVPVTLTVQAPPPQLSVNAATISFSAVAGSADPPAQSLQIANAGSGSVDWSASVTTTTGGSWLSVSPASGSATAASPAVLQIRATAASLAAADYAGSVSVSSATTGQTKTVGVTLRLSPSNQVLLVSQTGLTFTGVAGGNDVPPQSIAILNHGQGVMKWTVRASTSAGTNWLLVSPSSGTSDASSLDPPMVEVAVDTSGMTAGRYRGRVEVEAPEASDSLQVVMIDLTVLPAGSNPGPIVRPTGLVFTGRAGASPPAPQPVRVGTAAPKVVALGASPGTLDPGNWLKAWTDGQSFSAGNSRTITVQPTAGSLAAGVYRGAVTIMFDDGSSAQAVDVLFVVTGAGSGTSGAAGVLSQRDDAVRTQDDGPGCVAGKLYVINRTLSENFGVALGTGAPIEVSVKDECGPVANATVLVSFSNGDPPVQLLHWKEGIYTQTWFPGSKKPVTAKMTAVRPPQQPVDASVSGQVGDSGLPTLFEANPETVVLTVPAGSEVMKEVNLTSALPRLGWQATVRTTDGRKWLEVVPENGQMPSKLTVQANTSELRPDNVTYQGFVDIQPVGINWAPIPVRLEVVPPNPYINRDGIINGASFSLPPNNASSPGGLISIFGDNMASATLNAPALPLPKQLGATQVLISGVAAPLFYVSKTQINAQVPFEIPAGAPVNVVVRVNGVDSAPEPLATANTSPGIFTVTATGSGPGAILRWPDYSLVTSTAPVKPNDYVMIYCTGLGLTSPPVVSGAAGNGEATTNIPSVTIGGKNAPVTFSGAAPGFAALYQVNVAVPDLPAGDYDVVITAGGKRSPPGVTISVRP